MVAENSHGNFCYYGQRLCKYRRTVRGVVLVSLLMASLLVQAQTCAPNILPSPPTANFVINGDGTATDQKTRLTWDQCAWGATSGACELGAATTMNWQDALNVGASANAINHKGRSDWRLPNLKELFSIVETCRISPAINEQIFPNTAPSNFWPSTPTRSIDIAGSYAWYIDFYSGYSYYYGTTRTAKHYVRLVRGGL